LDLLRKEAAARGEVPKYDNRCRQLTSADVEEKLSSQLPYVVRFKLESHTEPWNDLVYGPISYDVAKIEGDPILMKSDGYPTYHLANVVDDHLMKISHVLRGVEWQVSTTKHILLYKAFDWQPPLFAHLPLLTNKDGKKLSKRQNDVHVEHYKNAGYFPEAILNLLTNMGSGFTVRHTAGMDMQQLTEHFDLSKLNTNSTRVDFDKLVDFNRLHLKQVIASDCIRRDVNLVTELRQIVLDKLNQENANNDLIKQTLQSNLTDNYLKRVLEWSKDRISLLSDLTQRQYNFLWSLPTSINLDNVEGTVETEKEMIQETLASITTIGGTEFSHETIALTLNTVGHSKAWKYSQYMKFLRKSLTGCLEGPSVAEIMTILGRETTMNRLHQLLNKSNDKVVASVKKNI
jgi:glutamyl-tRNA synthetase